MTWLRRYLTRFINLRRRPSALPNALLVALEIVPTSETQAFNICIVKMKRFNRKHYYGFFFYSREAHPMLPIFGHRVPFIDILLVQER